MVLKPAGEPELWWRVLLEEVCLQILAATSCMDSFEDSVKAAVNVLIEVGAIEVEEKTNSKQKVVERRNPVTPTT